MMPIYCYKCPKCGVKRTVDMSMQEMEESNQGCPPPCLEIMHRDYQSEGCNHIFSFTKGNMCRSSTGYATNIGDAEEYMAKDGKPVGHWVGKGKRRKIKRKKRIRENHAVKIEL